MPQKRPFLFDRIPKEPPARSTRRQWFFCLMSTFCFLLVLRNAEAAIAYMGRGLTLCARTVIPSLFPFMVISELLVSSGAGEAFGRLFSRVMKWLFGLSGAGVSALFLGSLCGFPVGARTAVSLYDHNRISKAECEHLLTFTSNPSSAFLISAVGLSLFGDRRLGVILYATVLGTSFAVGILARFFLRGSGTPEAHPHYPAGLHPGGVAMFTSAITSAATGMMTVCAYVVFFSALTGAVSHALSGHIGGTGFVLLSGFLEMTGGVSEAAGLANHDLAVILTAAIAGWSGLSVHGQVMTLCGGRGLSFKPYLIAKVAQGLLCALVMAVVLRLTAVGATSAIPTWLSPLPGTIMSAFETVALWRELAVPTVPAAISDIAFAAGLLLARLSPKAHQPTR